MGAATGNKLVNRNEITDATALAFAGSAEIPVKYIRPDEVLDGAVVVEEASDQELPVIDMARLLDPEISEIETAKLGSACRDWGFFQLINHGIDGAVVQQMKDSTTQFFSLPLDSKKEVAVRGDGFEGYGHHYTRTTETTGDKLDWAESVILITQPVHDRDTTLWPTNPPMFRRALEAYSAEAKHLIRQLVSFMAADLQVDQAVLLDAFGKNKRQSLAIHHYPPCRHPEKVVGNTAHTDGLGLTLLLHVNDTPGLQIKRDSRWFPVRPRPGAFVVNIGDILHIVTNGAYKNVEHRVLVDAERGRTTAVIFQDASVDGMVEPLPELLSRGDAARYKSVERSQYLKVRFSALAKRLGFLESFKV